MFCCFPFVWKTAWLRVIIPWPRPLQKCGWSDLSHHWIWHRAVGLNGHSGLNGHLLLLCRKILQKTLALTQIFGTYTVHTDLCSCSLRTGDLNCITHDVNLLKGPGPSKHMKSQRLTKSSTRYIRELWLLDRILRLWEILIMLDELDCTAVRVHNDAC